MGYANDKITAPVAIYDVQRALGSGSVDLATLCSDNKINPMAKFKPVRFNKVAPLTQQEFETARFGFETTNVPTFTGGNSNPSATWEYLKIRVGTDYSRLSDFSGYLHNATVPLAIGVSGALRSGLNVSFFVNSGAATYYRGMGKNWTWDEDLCISLSEFFTSLFPSSVTSDSYIAICIHDLDEGDCNVVVTNMQVSDLNAYVPTVILYSEQVVQSGVTYPSVPILNESRRNNHTFRIIVGLVNSNNAPSSSYAYKVYTEETSPKGSTLDLYSLDFSYNSDRLDLVLSDSKSIFGLKCTLVLNSSNMNYLGMETYKGQSMYKYEVSADLKGIFVTPSGHWNPDGGSVGVDFNMSANGFVVDASTGQIPSLGTSVSIPNANQTYTINNLYQVRNVIAYFPQGVPAANRSITISAFATSGYESIPFDNSVSFHAS